MATEDDDTLQQEENWAKEFIARSRENHPEDPTDEELLAYMAGDLDLETAIRVRNQLAVSPSAVRKYAVVKANMEDLTSQSKRVPFDEMPEWAQKLAKGE